MTRNYKFAEKLGMSIADIMMMPEDEIIIHTLLAHPEFNLGGSRRMNQKYPNEITLKPTTDWDFYTHQSADNINLLFDLGFECSTKSNSYFDDLLIDIFKHPKYPIEALIRSDVELYKKAFESIDVNIYMLKVWKSYSFHRTPLNQQDIRDFFNNLFRETRNNG